MRRKPLTARTARWTSVGMALLALLAATASCSRGPDAGDLRAEVKGKLDQHFKPGLFELVGLRRQGSSPLPASDTGKKRLAVYYNATLKLNQGYDFGNWEGLSPGTLAQVLGATEKGIYGVKAGESRPGEVIKVYGSSTYEWAGDRWQASTPSRPASPRSARPGMRLLHRGPSSSSIAWPRSSTSRRRGSRRTRKRSSRTSSITRSARSPPGGTGASACTRSPAVRRTVSTIPSPNP